MYLLFSMCIIYLMVLDVAYSEFSRMDCWKYLKNLFVVFLGGRFSMFLSVSLMFAVVFV